MFAQQWFEGILAPRDIIYTRVGLYRAQARGFGSDAELRRMVVEPAPLGSESSQLPEGWHSNCFGTVLGKKVGKEALGKE